MLVESHPVQVPFLNHIFFFLAVVLGLELRISPLLGRRSTT